MKKITLVAMLALASSGAFAAVTTVCSGANPQVVTGVTATSPAGFVQVSFTPKCSANVIMEYDEDAVNGWVASGSVKGKNTFKGSSAGGGVTVSAACPTTGCVKGDVDTALTAAAALGSGT